MGKDLIINRLIMKIINGKSFNVHYAKRMRAAWILAEKQYLKLTKEEKQKIIEEEDVSRKNGTRDGT